MLLTISRWNWEIISRDLGIPATDSFINIWGDRSGNQHHARAITSMPKFKKSGLNGKPTVQFTNDTMKVDNSETAFNDWSEISLFMVWQTKSGNTWTPLLEKRTPIILQLMRLGIFLARRPDLSPPYYRWQINGESSSSSPEISTTYSASIKSPNLLVLTYDGSHAKAWLNGNLAFNTSYSGWIKND